MVRLFTKVELYKEQGLTIQSNVMHGEDDWSFTLGNSLHRTVDSSMRSVHIMLLWVEQR